MGDRFVGYQERIKVPESMKPASVRKEVVSSKSKDELFAFISEPELMSEWFYEVTKFSPKQGGKFEFVDGSGASQTAICTALVLGREISFVADLFGEMKIKVDEGRAEIEFRILTDKPDEYVLMCDGLISAFERVAS